MYIIYNQWCELLEYRKQKLGEHEQGTLGSISICNMLGWRFLTRLLSHHITKNPQQYVQCWYVIDCSNKTNAQHTWWPLPKGVGILIPCDEGWDICKESSNLQQNCHTPRRSSGIRTSRPMSSYFPQLFMQNIWFLVYEVTFIIMVEGDIGYTQLICEVVSSQ